MTGGFVALLKTKNMAYFIPKNRKILPYLEEKSLKGGLFVSIVLALSLLASTPNNAT